ncbi:MAG: gamma-glutamyl-gamma-aminobutyrate hydrolase family protein [Bacteroidales bacterium]|nr:gamma-glutamyl-gamma-aminobutyrate hydrolase family protein [Bacteroidales bacterium]
MAHKSSLLIIDNFDSFTFNLVQLVEESEVHDYEIVRSDQLDTEQINQFTSILISPGPGLPADFPDMCHVIRQFGPTKRILGICLGHQAIAEVYGGRLINLREVNHGVTTKMKIVQSDEKLFDGVSDGESVGLYHSWVVDPSDLPGCLDVTAVSEEGNILALRHKEYDVWGLQFHPESIMTKAGKRIMNNWLKNLLFIPLLVLLLFASCKQKFEPVDERKVFRYNEAANITSLDPAFARDQANIWATHQLFNGLVQLNNKLEVLPCIARSWDISDDGLQYIFHLRQDVRFHDDPCFPAGEGRRVIADDFAYSFSRLRDPATAAAGAWVFNHVVAENPFLAIDDSTLAIRMANPFPPFPGLLTMQYCSVIPWEAVTYYGSEFRERPVGTGAFQLAYWKEGVKLVMIRNPHYFEVENGKQLPFLEAVSVTFLADKQAAFLQFVQGKLDFMSGIDPSYKDELLTREGQLNPKFADRFHLITQPYLNTEYLGILVDPLSRLMKGNSLKIKLVRKAINLAFDRRKMIMYLRNNIGIPGIYGMIPPGMPGFDSARIWYDYQPERAVQLLEEAGFSQDREIPSITLVTTPDYLDICKYIQHQVAAIGITLEIEVSPPAAVKEMKAQAKIPFFRASWIADYPDAENYLSLFYSPNFSPYGPNYTHYRNPEYDKLFKQSMSITEEGARLEAYQKMERIMMKDAPVIILYYDQVLRFVWNNVYGIGGNPMNLLTLKRVYKENTNSG